jgi:dTDP-L-rhamnose 4-epimerase
VTCVLLTGGAGFIGQHVLNRLLVRGHEVRVLDSLRPDVHPSAGWQPPLGVELQVGDVRDPAVIDRALTGMDTVIHLAAKVGLGVDLSDLPDYASTNDVGTAELLAGMARAEVARLVLASSMVVYGEGLGRCPEHGPVSPGPREEAQLQLGNYEPPCPRCGSPLGPALVGEDAPIDPRNAYASSKYAQELYAANWSRVTGGSAIALRYHNVFGPGMPRHTPYAGVAAIFAAALLAGHSPSVFEDGGQRRDFVHVRDIAAATVLACEHSGDGVRVFNVGSGTPRTVGEMAHSLARALNGPSPVTTGGYRLGDVRHITADSARIELELGWRAQENFDAGLTELAEQVRQEFRAP